MRNIFRIQRSVVAAVALAVTALTGAVTTAPVAAADPNCPATQVFFVPGTTETDMGADPWAPKGLMSIVSRNLRGLVGYLPTIYVPYQAGVLYGGSYNRSVQTGVDRTEAEIRGFLERCPGSGIVLGGFSQGADVAGKVASRIGNDQAEIPAAAVRAVTVISDPHRGSPGEELFGNPSYPAGSLGSRIEGFGSLAGRVATFCQDGDVYCSAGSVTQLVMWLAQFAAPNVTDPELLAAIPSAAALENGDVSASELLQFISVASNELIRFDAPTEIPAIHFSPEYTVEQALREYQDAQLMIDTGAQPHSVYNSDWAGNGTSTQTAARYIAARI